MRIDDELFGQLARLARLNFTPEEQQVLQADLEQIVGWVEQLQQCDVTGIAPQLHMAEANNLLRTDIAGEPMLNNDALASASDVAAPYFKVPKFVHR